MIKIPCFDIPSQRWSYIEFQTKKEWIVYLRERFKEPGKYNLHDTKEWIKVRRSWSATGKYTDYPKSTRGHNEFWLKEGIKCVKGVIYKTASDEFYLSGAFYFYLNFCPITVKHENNRIMFPEIWDTDYHIFLYLELAFASNRHSGVNKCRQKGWSNKVAAFTLRDMWFLENQVCKIFTTSDNNMKSVWRLATEFRTFIENNTGWIRHFKKDDQKAREWHMMWKFIEGGIQSDKGRNNRLYGILTSKNDTALVGGYNTLVVGDEVGVNPDLLSQITYVEPSLKTGELITGRLIIGGSVGELKECEDLRKITYLPNDYQFLGVPDPSDPSQIRLPFIATQWNYIEAIVDPEDNETVIEKIKHYDEDGNSNVEKALEAIHKVREQKKKQDAQTYQLYVSQNPISIDEMYQTRNNNIFPISKLNKQFLWLELNYKPLTYDLLYDDGGNLRAIENKKPIVTDFPLKNDSYREGTVCIYEMPVSNKPFIYYAGIDPVKNLMGKGESLMSIYIYQSVYQDGNELKGGKIVAWYTGRYYDDEDTYETVYRLCKFYNARMAIESDEGAFIEWVKGKGDGKMMMKRSEFPFLRDLVPNSNIGDEYGIKVNTGGNSSRVKNFIQTQTIRYLEEILGTLTLPNGDKQKIYGVERIKDQMLIKEMLNYGKGNFDRCFLEGNLILTKEGWVDVKNIKNNDLVVTHNGNLQKVINLFQTNHLEFNKTTIKLKGWETPITCTDNHPFLIYPVTKSTGIRWFKQFKIHDKLWKRADEIKNGDYFLIPKRNYLTDNNHDWRLLYILGWYLSDGNLPPGKNSIKIYFHVSQLKIAQRIKRLLEELDDFSIVKTNRTYSNGTVGTVWIRRKLPQIKKDKNSQMYILRFSSSVFNTFLREHVTILPNGGEKIIKPSLFNSKNLLPLVLGFFEGDGHQKYQQRKGANFITETLEISGAYQTLIRQIRQILLDNNIWCSSRLIPTAVRQNKFPNAKTKTFISAEMLKLDVQDLNGINKILNSIPEESLKFKLVNERKQKKFHIITKDGILIPFSKIITQPILNTKVYNFEVENENSYTVNGVATHNCSAATIAIATGMAYEDSNVLQKINPTINEAEKVVYKPSPLTMNYKRFHKIRF